MRAIASLIAGSMSDAAVLRQEISQAAAQDQLRRHQQGMAANVYLFPYDRRVEVVLEAVEDEPYESPAVFLAPIVFAVGLMPVSVALLMFGGDLWAWLWRLVVLAMMPGDFFTAGGF